MEEQGREREVPTQIDKERKKDDREENETKECLNRSRKCMKERERKREISHRRNKHKWSGL